MTDPTRSLSTRRLAVVLGLLACVGPFAIDMYLPALPAVADDLGASITEVQATLTVYFAAFGLSQLVWGPLSDQFGRKAPLLLGLAVFIAGSVLCALAPSIGWLLAARSLQAVGGSVLMIVPRAVIRDSATGTEATRLMAIVMLVISVSPMLAPLAGSGVIALGGWRAVFGMLAVAAMASVAVTLAFLPETLPPQHRVRASVAAMRQGARRLLADRWFMGLTLIGGLGFASFFVFLASAAFVYVETYGLSPTEFSLAFAAKAAGFFAASQAASWFGQRFGMVRVVLGGVTGFAAFATLLLALIAAGYGSLPVLIVCLVLANGFLGVVLPSTMVMALDPHGEIAGLASSLGGALQMLIGVAAVALSGPFFDGSPAPMAAAIAGCALLALMLAWSVLGPERRAGRQAS